MLILEGDLARLDALIGYVEGLPGRLPSAVSAAAEAIGERAALQYAAGSGPDGEPWPRTEAGEVPLRGPTSEIAFRGEGLDVIATAPDVLEHHQNGGPSLPRRRVFPDPGEDMPAPWYEAAEGPFSRVLEGGSDAVG